MFAGAIVKWMFDMQADRARKVDEADKSLIAEDHKLRDKVAELDKVNSTALATLTTGMEHIVQELAGIRGDMKEHRSVVFARIDRNETEIKDVKVLALSADKHLRTIEARLDNMKCAPK